MIKKKPKNMKISGHQFAIIYNTITVYECEMCNLYIQSYRGMVQIFLNSKGPEDSGSLKFCRFQYLKHNLNQLPSCNELMIKRLLE